MRDSAHGLFLGVTVHLFCAVVPKANRAVEVTHNDRVVSQVEKFSLLPQLLLGLFAFSDVAENHSEKVQPLDLDLGDGSFYWKFFTAGPYTAEAPERSHPSSGHTGVLKPADVVRVSSTEPIRKETVEWLPRHFLCCVPEHSFGGRIEKNYPLLLIERNDAIRHGIYDSGQPQLAITARM